MAEMSLPHAFCLSQQGMDSLLSAPWDAEMEPFDFSVTASSVRIRETCTHKIRRGSFELRHQTVNRFYCVRPLFPPLSLLLIASILPIRLHVLNLPLIYSPFPLVACHSVGVLAMPGRKSAQDLFERARQREENSYC